MTPARIAPVFGLTVRRFVVRQREYVDEIHVDVEHVSVAMRDVYEKSDGPKLIPDTRTPYAARDGTLLRRSTDNTGAAVRRR